MKTALYLALTAALVTSTAVAKDMNLQSAFPKGLPVVGPAADRFVETVDLLTDGSIKLKHLGAGELSPPTEMLDNVGTNALRCDYFRSWWMVYKAC